MKRNSFIAAALTVLLATFARPCLAEPTSALLDFTYDGNTGKLTVVHTFNERPSGPCMFRLRANIYYEGRMVAVGVSPLVSKLQNKVRVNRVVLKRMPGVAQRNGKDPILTIQAKSTCRGNTIVSNAVARFVKCGAGVRALPAQTFLNLLSAKLNHLFL